MAPPALLLHEASASSPSQPYDWVPAVEVSATRRRDVARCFLALANQADFPLDSVHDVINAPLRHTVYVGKR